MSRLLHFATKCFKFFKKKVGYILWGIAVGAKREQQELRPERMGQPRGHGQVRPHTQGDWTQIFPTIPIGLPYEDGPRTVMGVKY